MTLRTSTIATFVSTCALAAGAAGVTVPADDLAAEAWRADLRFLQQTVHADYPFLFKKTTRDEFDAEVDRLHEAIPALGPHEIVAGITRLVSSFQYGHTAVGYRESGVTFHHLPLNLYHFSDGVFVEGAHRDHESVLGARVVAIEGVPIEEALAAVRPLVPAENDQFFRGYGLRTVCVPEFLHAQGVTPALQREITLQLERDGTPFERTIAAVPSRDFPLRFGFTIPDERWASVRDQGATPHYLKNLDDVYYFEHLPEQAAVYVRHSQTRDDPDEDIPAFYARLFDFIEANGVERLILDVRLNGGGNNYKNKPIVTGILRCEQIDQPGRLFVIIGRRTFSACQNLVNELDTYTNAIFVGEPTAENVNFYGDSRQVALPNSGTPVYLSFAWWQDKPQWENGPWTAPHLAVEMSFDDYRTNRDPVLEAALTFTDDGFIRDPRAYIQSLYESRRYDDVATEMRRLIDDPRYRFFDFEGDGNRIGYELMGDRRFDAAIWVLELNTRLFPDSANAWDSLAEAHWRAGRPDEAVDLYEKAIALDPGGSVAANARSMLREIERERASDD